MYMDAKYNQCMRILTTSVAATVASVVCVSLNTTRLILIIALTGDLDGVGLVVDWSWLS